MAIDLKVDDAIALITLNRPDRLNALDAEHYDALAELSLTEVPIAESRLELWKPVIAAVNGYCVGGASVSPKNARRVSRDTEESEIRRNRTRGK